MDRDTEQPEMVDPERNQHLPEQGGDQHARNPDLRDEEDRRRDEQRPEQSAEEQVGGDHREARQRRKPGTQQGEGRQRPEGPDREGDQGCLQRVGKGLPQVGVEGSLESGEPSGDNGQGDHQERVHGRLAGWMVLRGIISVIDSKCITT